MSPTVTAILVARAGGEHLSQTLAALSSQTRQPDVLVVVDNGSRGSVASDLRAAPAHRLVTMPGSVTFGEAIEAAARTVSLERAENDVLWFLGQDSAPTPTALARLLGALEVSPSVAIVGPKQMEWDRPDYIAEYGLTLTRRGRTVSLVSDELDQGQHDTVSDVLAVGANGLLIRERVYRLLGGFDPGLPVVDDALDLCVRARLAGHRVSVVPDARVLTAGDGAIGPNMSARLRARVRRARFTRTAELYRGLAYAPAFVAFWMWWVLGIRSVFRSVWLLVVKRPYEVGGEFRSALTVAFSLPSISRSRSQRARASNTGWWALSALRMSSDAVRRRNALEREQARLYHEGARRPLHFFTSGGAWTTIALAIVSFVINLPLLGAHAIGGGALLPLSSTVGSLWGQVGFGWRSLALAQLDPADPFAWVVALMGTVTWWEPSFALVLLWFVALPLAGAGAWVVMARLTDRAGVRVFAGIAYGLAPTLLIGLHDGRPAAVMAHILLPWLFAAGLRAPRSWSASAIAALLFAAVVACAPSLGVALLVVWLGTVVLTGRYIGRFLAIPIPAIVLCAPVVVVQLFSGNPLGMLADPGPVVPFSDATRWEMALGYPTSGLGGWLDLTGSIDWGVTVAAGLVVLVLVAVIAALAVAGLFSAHPVRAQLALFVALLGLASAVATAGLKVAFEGQTAVALWPGAGLSLASLGLIVAASTGMTVLRRFSFYPAIAGTVAVVLLAVPLVGSLLGGTGEVAASTGRTLPAYVVATAASTPRVGTLVITPQPGGGIAAVVVRGQGLTLDQSSTLINTSVGTGEGQQQLALLAGDLSSTGGAQAEPQLRQWGIGYILLAPSATADASLATADAATASSRVRSSLDANPTLTPIGETDVGLLWSYPDATTVDVESATPASATQPWRTIILAAQSLVIILTLLVAIPTGPPRVEGRRSGDPVEDDVDDETVDVLAGDDDEA
jgi:GT2 family glycosyltransferase